MIKKEYKIVELSTVKGYEKNNKIHDKNVDEIVKSIQANTYISPIIVDENNIILAGHGRKLALDKLQQKQAEVLIVSGLTDKQKRDYRLRDNKLSELSERDLENIEFELKEIGDDELTALFHEIGMNAIDLDEEKEDEVPEVKGDIIVQRGDIFQLGEHRIMCGDSTDTVDVDKLMNGKKADMVFTDPPYGMSFEGAVSTDGTISGVARKHNTIKNDQLKGDSMDIFLDGRLSILNKYLNGAYYICYYRLAIEQIINALKNKKFHIGNVICRYKPNYNLSNSDYLNIYEPIIYGWKGKHEFYGYTCEQDVFHFKKGGAIPQFLISAKGTQFKVGDTTFEIKKITKAKQGEKYDIDEGLFISIKGDGDVRECEKTAINDLHPTMKPISLIERAINNSTLKYESVLDIFLGSGSTLIACEKTNRICYGMELDEHYTQVIIKRYHDYTNGHKEIKCLNRILDLNPILNEIKNQS